jgi:hypothetical protein
MINISYVIIKIYILKSDEIFFFIIQSESFWRVTGKMSRRPKSPVYTILKIY